MFTLTEDQTKAVAGINSQNRFAVIRSASLPAPYVISNGLATAEELVEIGLIGIPAGHMANLAVLLAAAEADMATNVPNVVQQGTAYRRLVSAVLYLLEGGNGSPGDRPVEIAVTKADFENLHQSVADQIGAFTVELAENSAHDSALAGELTTRVSELEDLKSTVAALQQAVAAIVPAAEQTKGPDNGETTATLTDASSAG